MISNWIRPVCMKPLVPMICAFMLAELSICSKQFLLHNYTCNLGTNLQYGFQAFPDSTAHLDCIPQANIINIIGHIYALWTYSSINLQECLCLLLCVNIYIHYKNFCQQFNYCRVAEKSVYNGFYNLNYFHTMYL